MIHHITTTLRSIADDLEDITKEEAADALVQIAAAVTELERKWKPWAKRTGRG